MRTSTGSSTGSSAGVNRVVDWPVGADRTSESLWREEDTFISPLSEQ
jgi:hypothetical protein